MNSQLIRAGLVLALAAAVPSLASAQDVEVEADAELTSPPLSDQQEIQADEPVYNEAPDAYPEPAMVNPEGEGIDVEIVDQAGVGGTIAYGRQGVIELGGSVGLYWAQHLFQFNVSPQLGVFVTDNFQISAIVDVRYANTEDGDGNRTDSTAFTFLAEPSYHLPVAETLFIFGGLGLGPAYNGLDAGFALQPRVGVNVLVGRSGIITPSVSLLYNTSGIRQVEDVTLLENSISTALNVGYSVMW
ncbi:MAG: hypothetical protein M3Y87_05420 [Myxococcota bacterium]|nr:hypothetical protein [Myxococcota bacterium]